MNQKQKEQNGEAATMYGAMTIVQLLEVGLRINDGDEDAAMAFALTTCLVSAVLLGTQLGCEDKVGFVKDRLDELWGPVSKLAEEDPEA